MEIKELENKLILMGLNGLAYTDEWNKIAKEINNQKMKGGKKR